MRYLLDLFVLRQWVSLWHYTCYNDHHRFKRQRTGVHQITFHRRYEKELKIENIKEPYLILCVNCWFSILLEGGHAGRQSSKNCFRTRQRKRATRFATLLQNESKNDIARFATLVLKPVNNLICCKTPSICVVKRTTSLLNSFCSNVARQVGCF